MTPAAILTQIKTTLTGNADLTTFGLKKVFEGIRENVSTDDYPFIAIEPAENDEERAVREINGNIDPFITFGISGFIRDTNPDTQLATLFNFEKLIKVALCADVKLGGNAVNSKFGKVLYDNQFWPVRAVMLTFVVQYRQNFKTRV